MRREPAGMSFYGVSKLLFEVNRDPAVRAELARDREGTLARYPLSDAERRALAAFDFRPLYDLGVHPLLLTALANCSGIPIPAYLESIRTGRPVPPHLVGRGTAARGGQ